MEVLFEILFQFVGEVLLQIVFEALAELGLQSLREPFKKPLNPWLAAVGYAVFGTISGALSLWVFPLGSLASNSTQFDFNTPLNDMSQMEVLARAPFFH